MPYTLNGCGTSFYGKRHPAEDGSYVTTLWVTFLWVPLIPLRSYRVRPVGKGTNIVIHSSQSYQTRRVPLCWPQVRNIFCFTIPILGLILYFNASDIERWWKGDVSKPNTPVSLTPEPSQGPPASDLPLDSRAAAVACGKLMKLDKDALVKLDLPNRLSELETDSGITNEEMTPLGDSAKDLDEEAFEAYSFGYITWEKSREVSRADFDKMIINAVQKTNQDGLSSAERAQLNAYLVKVKRMMVQAFDLGRHDAKTSPCTY